MAERVSAIIPAHNEADVIARTVASALAIPGVTQVIVVDDASTDGTAMAAQKAGAHKVIILENNKGKGGALNAGLQSADNDVLLLLDADLGSSASEALKLITPLLEDKADMTIALFGKVPPIESEGLAARSGGFGVVVKFARFGIKLLTGKQINAPLSGQRALKREIIERSGGFASRFGVEVALTIDAVRMGYRIEEVPVGMVHRASGRDISGFLHRGAQMVDVFRALVRKR
ncbi:MAG: glycosyltransferase family 2 protein [Armatimonadota bacterium]